MSLTPKKKEYGSYIYKFFEEQDSLSKKYKCKSCENNIVGPVTNLRKHINTTNENPASNKKINRKENNTKIGRYNFIEHHIRWLE